MPTASVMEGSTRAAAPPVPAAMGKSPSARPKAHSRMSPSQKPGRDSPAKVRPPMSRSVKPPRRAAAKRPSGTETSAVSARDAAARASVAGKRARRTSVTGACIMYDQPRSPVRAAASHRPNCTKKGASRPICRVTAAISSGETGRSSAPVIICRASSSVPSMTSANMRKPAPSRVRAASASRAAAYRILSPSFPIFPYYIIESPVEVKP